VTRALVTGGAGYIGSHVVRALVDGGHDVLVADDLSNGHAADVAAAARLERVDVTAPGVLERLGRAFGAQVIVHFAARIQVGESVARPELYYATNVGGMLRVIECATALGAHVVFSSTAAVYGEPRLPARRRALRAKGRQPDVAPIPVEHPCRPSNPYGRSKWIGEQMLADAARAGGFGWVALRYFNAAGAADGLGEKHAPETHLIPLAIDAATGGGASLSIFGDDWPTPDGTCIRDYIHVVDLADAHVFAVERFATRPAGHPPSGALNLGTGHGASVREVLAAVERATGRAVPSRVAPRRPGDVAVLVADPGRARDVLAWQPRRSSLDEIVRDAVRARRGSLI
jgi:UDP-glucose-4-epimerase GalE